jgi:class I fructose-bisphosphate aldolase
MENVIKLLGKDARNLLEHQCQLIPKESIGLPSSDFLEKVFVSSNRNPQVLRSLAQLFGNGNLKDTGYLSILPVDQGIEHTAVF